MAINIQELDSSVRKQPCIETSVKLSRDKKWLIHKTTITDLRPITIGIEIPNPKFEVEVIEEIKEELVEST